MKPMPAQPRTIKPLAFHRLFVRQKITSIELRRDELRRDEIILTSGPDSIQVDLATATLSSSRNWIVLRSITLSTPQSSFDLAGLTQDAVADIEAAIQEAHRRGGAFRALLGQTKTIRSLIASWDALTTRDTYLTSTEAKIWLDDTPSLMIPDGADADLADRLSERDRLQLRKIISLRNETPKAVDRRNADYVAKQLLDFKQFFDTVESKPLTDQQRQAIVHDEDNALVIAGAGTGKTSTVVGKVGFVLNKGWVKPEEILLLAFTNKAATEMRERVVKRLGADVAVRTFHGLGLEIITQVGNKKPSVSPEAEDTRRKEETLKELITDLIADDGFRDDLLAFCSSLPRTFRPAWEFKSLEEYTQYLLDVEPRSLNGQLLRSYEECEIANWLVIHGISFKYECPYKVETATFEHRQYRPDFYLPEHDFYIEHWGVDKKENAPSFMNPVSYRAKMDWARALHKEHGTTLIQTYSWEKQEGTLLSGLQAKLLDMGVQFSPISAEAALMMLNEKGRIDPFIRLVSTFLSLFKSAGHSTEELRLRAGKGGDAARAERFLRLFWRVSQRYEALLHERGEIDFDDMITLAHEHVKDGSYQSVFRYILVDEFQDISLGRARLIQALRDQLLGTKLFCVGDDWQSIYRFTGSDISLTTDFLTHFGPTRATALNRTFRFHDRITAFSSRFVQKNPSQLRKQLSTEEKSDRPGVVVYQSDGQDDPLLLNVLTDITAEVERSGKDNATVFLLSRYKHTIPANLGEMRRRFPRLLLRGMTAHASKGLEADYVAIVGLCSGKYGFPSEIADDPVLGMVLADREAFEFAEERRLFYVALTRARRRVYVVADATSPSSFVREVLAEDEYEKLVVGSAASASNVCPACGRGKVMRREGEFGVFYSCSNYPICEYKAAVCSRCGQGRIRHLDEGNAMCDECGCQVRACPRCRKGILLQKRNSKNGSTFWGCSNYQQNYLPCSYTESTASRQI